MNLNADTCTSPRLDLGKKARQFISQYNWEKKPGNLIPNITGKKKAWQFDSREKKKPGNLIPRSKIDLK